MLRSEFSNGLEGADSSKKRKKKKKKEELSGSQEEEWGAEDEENANIQLFQKLVKSRKNMKDWI